MLIVCTLKAATFLATDCELVSTCVIIALAVLYLFFFKDCLELDPCCEPKGCKLKRGSQCSVLNHACCQDCVVSFASLICCHRIKTNFVV